MATTSEATGQDGWAAVARLRSEAERYAAAGDTLAAAMLDQRASKMAERLRASEAGRGGAVSGAPIRWQSAPAPAAGTLHLDPEDGELVQVLPASAWDPERWGPPAALPVVRILAPAPRSRNKPGEVAQRDLTGWTRVPPEAVAALRALPYQVVVPPGGASIGGVQVTEPGTYVIWPGPAIEPRAAALHACLVCGRHPATHRAGSEDEVCQACGLGDEREGGS